MRMNESQIINLIAKQFPAITPDYVGIGDDAALLFHHSDRPLLITTDALVEDVHFRLSYFTPEALAHKVLHVNMSDIAAMGGHPQHLLLNLSIPLSLSAEWLTEFIHHITQLCHRYTINIIGGDTTRSPDKLYISVTLIGSTGKSIKRRSHAKATDLICVTGPLGGAHAGLIALEQKQAGFDDLKNTYLFPEAKIKQGEWLSGEAGITSMMDLSDGLYLDLAKLCQASNVGARINTESIPISTALKKHGPSLQLEPLSTAIAGGEDYELLVTLKAEGSDALLKAYQHEFQNPLYVIGHITTEHDVIYLHDNKKIHLNLKPYTHFGGKS